MSDDGLVGRMFGRCRKACGAIESIAADDLDGDAEAGGEREVLFAVTKGVGVVQNDDRHADVLASLRATARMTKAMKDASGRFKGEENMDSFRIEVNGELSFRARASEFAGKSHVTNSGAGAISANGEWDSAVEYALHRAQIDAAWGVISGGEFTLERQHAALVISVVADKFEEAGGGLRGGVRAGGVASGSSETPVGGGVGSIQPSDDAAAPPVLEPVEEAQGALGNRDGFGAEGKLSLYSGDGALSRVSPHSGDSR